MRKILFRGKRADNGEWIFGDLLHDHYIYDCVEITQIYDHKSRLTHRENIVISETVGQYTGVTDKNGTMIFEGDIVKYGDSIHTTVFEQRSGTAYFGLVYSQLETLPFGYYQDLRQIEVIGNIHDNPELLEV